MSYGTNRIEKRRQARAKLDEMMRNPNFVNVIHYSSQTIHEDLVGSPRRITSIAVLNLGSGQIRSFSIHLLAERRREDGSIRSLDDIQAQYDQLERQMLTEYYEFVKTHVGYTWLHWNMRDTGFGFPALDHRFQSLVKQAEPVQIPDAQKVNLPDILRAVYGRGFAADPQMQDLMTLNGMTYPDFLTGRQEAEAFSERRYVAMHASTMRKVQMFRNFTYLAWEGRLRTRGGRWQRALETPVGVIENVTDHWMFKLLGAISIIITLLGGVALLRSVL